MLSEDLSDNDVFEWFKQTTDKGLVSIDHITWNEKEGKIAYKEMDYSDSLYINSLIQLSYKTISIDLAQRIMNSLMKR